MYFCYIWQAYSTGIIEIELANVEIQEQTASLHKIWVNNLLKKRASPSLTIQKKHIVVAASTFNTVYVYNTFR